MRAARGWTIAAAALVAGCGAPADGPAATDPAPVTTGTPATPATEPPAPPTVPATTTAPPPPTRPADEALMRNLPVVVTTVGLVDASRPVVSRGRTLSATRALPTTVAAPATGGPYPLVLFAHGFQLGPPGYRRIIEAVAAAGYVVAAPSFPLADPGNPLSAAQAGNPLSAAQAGNPLLAAQAGNPLLAAQAGNPLLAAQAGGAGILDRADIPNQSADLRFVADRLVADPSRRIDGTRIGAVGHSDGADTVLDLGYHVDRFDPRIRAVAALAADAVPIPGGAAACPPLLLVHGSADRVTPPGESAALFGRLAVPRWLVTLTGADHLAPVQGAAPWAAPHDRALLALLDRFVGGRAGAPDVAAAAAAAGVTSVDSAP